MKRKNSRMDIMLWTDQEREVLAESVRETGTLIDGFKLAADTIGEPCTYHACRNQWYNSAMKPFKHGIELTNRKTSEVMKLNYKEEPQAREVAAPVQEAVKVDKPEQQEDVLEAIKEAVTVTVPADISDALYSLTNAIDNKIKAYQEEINDLKWQNATIVAGYEKLESQYETLLADYHAVVKVINMAKDLANKEHLGEKPSPQKFNMDKNGNLEVVRAG